MIKIQRQGYSSIIKAFLEKVGSLKDITMNVDGNEGTILHAACYSGDIDLVKHLISLDEINIKSKDIFSPFIY